MRGNPLYETADLHQKGTTHKLDITRVTAKAPAVRRSNPKTVQIRRLGTTKRSRQPSMSPPICSPNIRPLFAARAVDGAVVLTVRVALATVAPVMDADAGTVQVGAAVDDEPPETAQLN